MQAKCLVVTGALVSLTWPMSVAYAALRYVFVRPYVADAAAALAAPATAIVAFIVAAVSLRAPTDAPTAWIFRCALAGACVGDIWLACATYVQSEGEAGVFWGTIVGGLLYGAPAGVLVGMALGAEMVAIQHWSVRARARLPDWGFVVVAVALNAIVAVGLWYGASSVNRTGSSSLNFVGAKTTLGLALMSARAE